jgi:hypothetical protein
MLTGGISSTFSIINVEVFGSISQNIKHNRNNRGTTGQQTRGLYTSPRLGGAKSMRISCIIMEQPSISRMLI